MIIKTSDFFISATNKDNWPEEIYDEYMFCGRSNVGKSSFINMILNRKNLARTSSNPGKTQTLNYYIVNDSIYFVDVPGYGYAKVSKKQREEFGKMIEEYLLKRNALKLVFLLVDIRHKPTNDDCLMYDFLKYYNKDVVIIATKADKLNKSERIKSLKIIKETLKLNSNDKLIMTSSETKEGLNEVLALFD